MNRTQTKPPQDLRRPARRSSRRSPVIQLDLFGAHCVIFQDEKGCSPRRRDGGFDFGAPRPSILIRGLPPARGSLSFLSARHMARMRNHPKP
jgi:hypothetical protein